MHWTYRKTAVTPVLMHWSYCSLVLSHQYWNKTVEIRHPTLYLPAECDDCTGGMYCETPGLTEPTAQCSAGYYCDSGASTPTPTDGVTGDICQLGDYCTQGSAAGMGKHPGFNSLAPGRFKRNFTQIISKLILVIDGWDFFCEIALRWMSLHPTDN